MFGQVPVDKGPDPKCQVPRTASSPSPSPQFSRRPLWGPFGMLTREAKAIGSSLPAHTEQEVTSQFGAHELGHPDPLAPGDRQPGPQLFPTRAFQVIVVVKNPPANAGDTGDAGLIPRLGRSPGGGHGNQLQDSCLENPLDRGAWWATVHGVTKSQTQLKRLGTHTIPTGGQGASL